MKKNLLYIIFVFSLVLFLGYVYSIYSKPQKQSQIKIEEPVSAPVVLSETASSTNQKILNKLKDFDFRITNNSKQKPVLGDIILQKDFLGNKDIIGFAWIIDSKSQKVFYLVQFREVSDSVRFISSSRIDDAEKIIGLRAADSASLTEYYVDVQFRPSDSQETQGVIKTIGEKGIQEDTTI